MGILDIVSVVLDLQTKAAVSRLSTGGVRNVSSGPARASTFASLLDRVVSELGLGSHDEARFQIDLGKLTEERRAVIMHLIGILDTKQLKRIRLIAFNAPSEVEKTEKFKAKKGKDGGESEPEREVITHKGESGSIQFLNSLADMLKGKSDKKQLALLSKLDHLPGKTHHFVAGAFETIDRKLHKRLELAPDEAITFELLLEKLTEDVPEEQREKVPMGPLQWLFNSLLFGAKDESRLVLVPPWITSLFKSIRGMFTKRKIRPRS